MRGQFTSPRWGEVGAERRVRGRFVNRNPSPGLHLAMQSDLSHATGVYPGCASHLAQVGQARLAAGEVNRNR